MSKEKFFVKIFSEKSNLDDLGITSRINLHSIPVTPKIIYKVITDHDSSKTCGPDFFLLVFVRNCDSELLDI